MYLAVAVAVTGWSVTETHGASVPAGEEVGTIIHEGRRLPSKSLICAQ
ncbi:hypothetical protein SAMN05216328_1208 [Ensifer sp. YR511]|nr:hypothetical protein SAMN05216328_1208 [Ensifer sp. YR511]